MLLQYHCGVCRGVHMEERIQGLIKRLDTLLENNEIDQSTYEQMRDDLETKLNKLHSEAAYQSNMKDSQFKNSKDTDSQDRIQSLIKRLDTLLENNEIDQSTYEQMLGSLNEKMTELQNETTDTINEDELYQLNHEDIKGPQQSTIPEIEDINSGLEDYRPSRELIIYLKIKYAYRELLTTKNTLIEQGIDIRKRYQHNQISRSDFLTETSEQSMSLSNISEALETKRELLLESRPRFFQLMEQLTFLQKKEKALESVLSLDSIDTETHNALKKEIQDNRTQIQQKIQFDIENLSKGIQYFMQEIQYHQKHLQQNNTHEQTESIEKRQQRISERLNFIKILQVDISLLSNEIKDFATLEDKHPEITEQKNEVKIAEYSLDISETELVMTINDAPKHEPVKISNDEKPRTNRSKSIVDLNKVWDCVGKLVKSNTREIGVCSQPITRNGEIYIEIISRNEIQDPIIEEIYNLIKSSLTSGEVTNPTKMRIIVADYISKAIGVEKQNSLSPTVIKRFFNQLRIPIPAKIDQTDSRPIGLVPFSNLPDSKSDIIFIQEESIEPLTTDGQLTYAEERFSSTVCVGMTIRNSMGQIMGSIKDIHVHSELGQIMIVESDKPRIELLDRLIGNTNQTSTNNLTPEEKNWLIRFLVAKKLGLYETEPLTPDNIISFCLIENIPILPSEIRCGYLSWISSGFLNQTGPEFSIKGFDTVLKPFPDELYEIEFMRIITKEGITKGYAIGFDYIEGILKVVYASHFSENLIPVISDSPQLEDVKSTFMEMMNTVSTCLNIPKDKGLMPSSILRFILKEKLKSKTKLKTLKQSYKEMKMLLRIEIIDLTCVDITETGILLIEDNPPEN